MVATRSSGWRWSWDWRSAGRIWGSYSQASAFLDEEVRSPVSGAPYNINVSLSHSWTLWRLAKSMMSWWLEQCRLQVAVEKWKMPTSNEQLNRDAMTGANVSLTCFRSHVRMGLSWHVLDGILVSKSITSSVAIVSNRENGDILRGTITAGGTNTAGGAAEVASNCTASTCIVCVIYVLEFVHCYNVCIWYFFVGELYQNEDISGRSKSKNQHHNSRWILL